MKRRTGSQWRTKRRSSGGSYCFPSSDLPETGYAYFSTAPISFAQAALGGDVRIKTVDGDVIYTVKPGTKTDTKVRLRGKGVPSIRNSQVRGDHYVTLVIQTPERLSSEAKEALKKFDALTGNTLNQSQEELESAKKGKKKDLWIR